MKRAIFLIILPFFYFFGICLEVVNAQSADDQRLCNMYRERLKKYEKEGVMGINPMTGQIKRMTGEAEREAIKDVKDNIKIFCDGNGTRIRSYKK